MASVTRAKSRLEPDHRLLSSGRSGAFRRRALVVASDVTALLVGVARSSGGCAPAPTSGCGWSTFYNVVFWTFIIASNLYNSRLASDRTEELVRVVRSGIRAMLVLGLAVVALGADVAYRPIVMLFLSTACTVAVGREGLRRWFARRRRAGEGLWGSVLVAGEVAAADFRRRIEGDSSSPHTIVAHVDPDECDGAEELLTKTVAAARSSGAQGAIVVESLLDASTANQLVRGLLQAHLYVDLASTLVDISADRLATRTLGSGIVTWIAPRPRSGWRGRAKRLFDVAVAALVLVAVSPVFAAIALAIKVTSPGPVFFRQQRVGRYGVPFDMLKFRSMVVDAEELLGELQVDNEGAGPLFKMAADPRGHHDRSAAPQEFARRAATASERSCATR